MRLIEPLTIEEVKALLAAPDGRTYGGLRDRAMLHMAYACGLRASELLAIQINAFPPGSLATVRIHGKGRRARVLPLWRGTPQARRRWIRPRCTVTRETLFLTCVGGPLLKRNR